MEHKISLIKRQIKCSYKKAKEILIKNNGDLDDALYCLMTNKTIYEEEKKDTSHMTNSQKKIKELREIVDIKDTHFRKIMENMGRSKTKIPNKLQLKK